MVPGRWQLRNGILAAGLVCLVTFLVFLPGVTGGHLSADDWGYTYGCPFVKNGLSIANIVAAVTDPGHGAIWMPLTYLTYMCDISLLGGGWEVHHAVNVLFHAANALLLFVFLFSLMLRLGLDRSPGVIWACVVGTLTWALHPLRAEAVVYVASRKDELWTLFALLGLLTWLRSVERRGVRWYLATFVCFGLSCLSKPTAVCFPLLAFATEAFLRRSFRCRLLPYLPLLCLSLSVGLLAVYSQSHPTGYEEADVFVASFAWRLLNAAVALGLYLWHAIVPTGLHLDYRAVFNGWPVDGALGLVVLAVTVSVCVLVLSRTKSASVRWALAYAAAFFVLGIFPTLGVFGYVNGDQACADRYTYLPLMAVSFLVVPAVLWLGERLRLMTCGLCACLLGIEVFLALPVIRSFENDYQAAVRTLARDPDHWRALRTVGNEYCARLGRMDEGVKLLYRSLKLHDSQRTADALAYVLAIRGAEGDFAEVERLGKTIACHPKLDKAGLMLDALGIARMRTGDYAAAVRFFSAALSAPHRTHMTRHSQLNLGLCLANAGSPRDALSVLNPLCRDPDRTVRARAAGAVAVIRSNCPHKPFEWK